VWGAFVGVGVEVGAGGVFDAPEAVFEGVDAGVEFFDCLVGLDELFGELVDGVLVEVGAVLGLAEAVGEDSVGGGGPGRVVGVVVRVGGLLVLGHGAWGGVCWAGWGG